ncbi:hypothetical protein MRX96_012731 [Rhipicephalus microplus]
MPLPRREKTTYNDIRQPATEQVPHIPSSPPNPVCIRQSVQKYRDRVMPDWFQKRRWFRGQAGSGSLYRCPPLSCYYRQYARDSGVCQSFVPLLHTMRLSEELRAPQLSPVQQRKRRPLQCAARAMR